MEAKQARHEHSVAKFASIALLHQSLNKKLSTRQKTTTEGEDEDNPSWDSETISLPQLMQIKRYFEKKRRPLTSDEFVEGFTRAGSHMSAEHLTWWFKRIDADNSGTVDWNELAMFMISGTVDAQGRIVSHDEFQEDAMFTKDEKGVSMPPTEASPNAVAGYNHSDYVTGIYCHPRMGKYFTASQDGTVRVWDATTLEFELILHQGKWVTGICPSVDDTLLFVAGLDRSITVYELVNLHKTPKCYIGNILDEHHRVPKGRPIFRFEIQSRNIPEVGPIGSGTGQWRNETLEQFRMRNERIRYRQIPDQTVEAHVLRQMEFPAACLSCCPRDENLYVGLSNGRIQGYPIAHRSMLRGGFVDAVLDVDPHSSFPVTTLMWADFFEGFLSTASDGSVALTNIATKTVIRVGVAANPIYSAVWMEGPRLLATSGACRDISLWSASAQTSTMTLSGHFCAVVALCYDANDNWLVSLDNERTIIVWNMYNTQPIQSTTDYDVYQLRRFSSMQYDVLRNRIVCASCAPVIFAKGTNSVPLADPSYKGHQRPIVSALYNKVFHQIITADSECIKIWEASNGSLRACLSVASVRSTGIPVPFAGGGSITSVKQDFTERRLLIGLSSATVIVMNMSNCHMELECHRNTVKLLPAVDAGAVCFLPIMSGSRDGKKGLALVVGNKMLIWEDKANVSSIGLERELVFDMKRDQFDAICQHQQAPVPLVPHWRSPQPTCTIASNGVIYVGTDSGMVFLYGQHGAECTGFFGIFDPKATVTSIAEHKPSKTMVFSLTNGRVMIASYTHRNRQIEVLHEDDSGVPVPLLCCDCDTKYLVTGDEDGTVHVWELGSLDLDELRPFTAAVVTRSRGSAHLKHITSFRAHLGDVSSIGIFNSEDQYFVLTSSSDCQVRVFMIDGRFVGYVGSTWKLQVGNHRSTLRNVPAPIHDLAPSKSFLGGFLPGIADGAAVARQNASPMYEDLYSRQSAGNFAQQKNGAVVIGSRAKGGEAAVTPQPNTPMLIGGNRKLSNAAKHPKFEISIADAHEDELGKPPAAGDFLYTVETTPSHFLDAPTPFSPRNAASNSKTVRDGAQAMLNQISSGPQSPRQVRVQASPKPPPQPQALLGKPTVNCSIRRNAANPLINRAEPDANALNVITQVQSQVMDTSPEDSMSLDCPVTLAGHKPVASLSLDGLLANAIKPKRIAQYPAPPLATPTATSRSSQAKSQTVPSTKPRVSIVASESGTIVESHHRSGSTSASAGPSSAAMVATMVPRLHLDKIPKSKLPLLVGVSTAQSAPAESHDGPHSSRLDEWRAKHRQWLTVQEGEGDMVKSARPMSLVRIQTLDNDIESQVVTSLRRKRESLASS